MAICQVEVPQITKCAHCWHSLVCQLGAGNIQPCQLCQARQGQKASVICLHHPPQPSSTATYRHEHAHVSSPEVTIRPHAQHAVPVMDLGVNPYRACALGVHPHRASAFPFVVLEVGTCMRVVLPVHYSSFVSVHQKLFVTGPCQEHLR
jgi:hypothetical protein